MFCSSNEISYWLKVGHIYVTICSPFINFEMSTLTGTLRLLAKHPTWPMGGVTLRPVSNTTPTPTNQGIASQAKSVSTAKYFYYVIISSAIG